MIYSNILKPRFRYLSRIFVLFLVVIFTLSLYSCQTTYDETYSPEQLRASDENGESKILEVKTKTDSTINLVDYDAKYDRNENAIICKKTDTTLINNGTTKQIKERIMSKIDLKNVLTAKFEKEKTNVPLTILTITGITLLLLVIAIVVDAGQGGWLFGH